MPRTGLRLGVQTAGTVSTLTNGPIFNGNNADAPKQGGVFMEFEVERYPSLSQGDGEFLATVGGLNSTDDLRLYVTPGGSLVLKHDDAGPPQTLWTSPPVGLHAPHTLELRFRFNSQNQVTPSPNPVMGKPPTSRAQVFFDGALVAVYGANAGGIWSSGATALYGLDTAEWPGCLLARRVAVARACEWAADERVARRCDHGEEPW